MSSATSKSGIAVALAVSALAVCLAAPKKSGSSKLAPGSAAKASSEGQYFYVYTEQGSKFNHYAPSGWMGDYGDLKVDQGWKDNPAEGKTCIRITYSAKRSQGAGWAGIYWQQPANNWGNKAGGYDLSKYKSVTFWVRGGAGGEKMGEFKAGGISGQMEKGDSDTATTGPVTLTADWKKYTIDLAGKDLSYIIGGFCFAANADDNPNGFDLYLDEIRYE